MQKLFFFEAIIVILCYFQYNFINKINEILQFYNIIIQITDIFENML